MRVGNSVFVSREGADRVTFNKKTGTITKTIKQAGGRKRIRAPMNPQAQDVDKVFEQLSEKEVLMLRSASGKGITSGGNAYDKKAWISYKAERQKTIAAQVRRTQGLNAKDARKYAKQIMDDWYTVEVEYDDEE